MNTENSGITAGSFGVVGLIFALQFFSEVPKVRKDIMQVRTFLIHSNKIYLPLSAIPNRIQSRMKGGDFSKQGINQKERTNHTKEETKQSSTTPTNTQKTNHTITIQKSSRLQQTSC